MALVAEPSVVDSVMSTSTEGLADLENESMSVSSSDLSSCEVDVQGETVEMENDTSSIDESPKEPESVQEALQVEDVDSNEGKGQKEAVLVEVALPGPGQVPEPDQSVTLDEVEVTATMVVVDNEVITGADEEIDSTSEVLIPDTVPMETQTEEEEVTVEKDEKREDCTEVVVEEDETIQVVAEVENTESGTGNTADVDEVVTAGDVEADLSAEDEDNSKENKENEAVEPSEGQIILTGTTSIVSDPDLTPTEVELVAEVETTPTSTSAVAVTVESEAPPPVDDDDDDVRVVDADEIDLTLTSPISNKSVQVCTSTSEIENPDSKNSDSDKSKLTDECPEETLADPKLELGAGVVKPKIEDVENNINKIIHKSQSSKDAEPSVQEIKNELGDQIRSMMRGDLETLIVDKIIEAIAIHSNVGVLNQKLHQANAQKDRLFHKISNLQRQVTELSKAVRSVSENVGRNQKTVNKTNQPIRFYRSVGVQVFLEGPINPPPQSRSLSQPEFPKPVIMEPKKSVLKSGNNNTPSSLIPQSQQLLLQQQQHSSPLKPVPGQVPLSTILNGNVHPALKRTMAKPSISVAEVARQIDIQNKVRKVGSGNGSPAPSVSSTPPKINSANGVGINSKSPLRASPGMQQQPQHNMVMRNPAAAMATKVLNLNGNGGPMMQIQGASNTVSISKTGTGNIEPGIVDLTDDDAVVTSSNSPPKKTIPPATATTASSLMLNGKNNANNVVPFQNGVQYRLVSQGPQYHLVQNGANYHIVTSGNQTRPVFVSPTGSAPKMGSQVRPVSAQSISLLRGLVPGSQGNVGGPININAGGQIMMRPMVASAAAKQQANAVTPMMVKQQQFQQQGLGQQMNASMVARQQQQQGAAQVNSNKAMSNNPVGLRIPNQTVRPMGQVPRVNTRAAVDAAKKFILPPLPPPAIVGNPRRCSKDIPPRPDLNLTEQEQGIVLSWTLKLGPNHAEIQTYQIYACQEPLFNNPKSGSWKRVGDVKALPLPMACTLSQFTDENRYHFIVRGVDVYNRTGPFCEAAAITLKKK